MSLDSATKKAYKEGIFTLFDTLGTQVEFYFRDTKVSNQDIYGDLIEESPIEVLTFVADVKHKALDYNNFDIKKQGHTDEVTVTIPLLAIEKVGVEPFTMDSGYFVVNNRHYEVMNITPKDVFGQMYTSYEFDCKGVKPQ